MTNTSPPIQNIYSSHLMINHRTHDKSSFIAHKSSSSIPTIASLCAESQATLPVSEAIVSIISDLPLALNPVLNDSLFFVQFTPAGTMLRRWYLIQIDLASTNEMNPDYLSNGEYWCVFLDWHSSDKRNSDEFSRWWPEWHSYTACSTSKDIIYDNRYEFRPFTTPPSSKYIQWSTLLPILGDNSTTLVDPFTFTPVDSTNRVRHTVAYDHWKSLITACNFQGILPSTTGINSSHTIPQCRLQPSRANKKRKLPWTRGGKNYQCNFEDANRWFIQTTSANYFSNRSINHGNWHLSVG